MTTRTSKIQLVLTLLIVLTTADLPAADGSAEAPFRFYSAADGLTQSDVYDIEQDRAGYLWFTTARGLNRYDGTAFDHYTIADGLPTNNLTALHVDADNTVWVGDSHGGISVLHAARVVEVIAPPGEGNMSISDIETYGDKVLVAADGLGLLEVSKENDEFGLRILTDQVTDVKNVVVFGTAIWVVAESGLYQLDINREVQLRLLSAAVTQMHAAADGTLWVIDRDNRVGIWQRGAFKQRAVIDSPDPLINITTGADATIWVASGNKLFSFDGDDDILPGGVASIRSYGSINETSSLFVDQENTLWLSSDSRLIRFLGDRFRHYRLKSGSDSETVWAISQDQRGRMWFGTQTKLLLQRRDETLSVIGPDNGIPAGPVRDLVHDGNGNLWVGVRGHGLYRLSTADLGAQLVEGTDGLEVLDIAIASDGDIWFSTFHSGVYRFAPGDGTLRNFPAPEKTTVYSLDTGADGSVWFGADEVGIVQLKPAKDGEYTQTVYGEDRGLSHALFNHIRLTGEESAWVAAEEGGLYRFAGGRFEDIGSASPLSDQTVYLVEPLANGTLIVGGEQGLYQIDPNSGRIAHYNHLLGFIGVETDVHATFVDSRGQLWIGTVDGATSMDVSMPMPDFRHPDPQIVSMYTELDEELVLDNADIRPAQRGIQVEFAAVSLRNPKGIEYSYRLAGLQNEWGAATSNRSVRYSRIPPGSYEFMVRARYPGGGWSNGYASQRFTVLPFFWQRPLFVLSVLLLVLLVIRGVLVYRTRKIEQLNEALRAEVTERTLSIEQARQHLELSNEQLSQEIIERQKSDQARVEVEARFRRAFENAPIGMGLLDEYGMLFDANPALLNMFWPKTETRELIDFPATIGNDDRDRFMKSFVQLAGGEIENLDERLSYTRDDGETLQTVVNLSAVRSKRGDFNYAVLQVQDITESMKLTGQLEYQASYDELTGLLNRRSFESELDRAWTQGKTADSLSYLMFMDLDQFKVVNDTSGHAAGDQLLKGVSKILLDSVRGDDCVCRLGGDEFGIILWECPTDVATRIAESIRASIEGFRFQWDAETYRIGVSIGGLPIDPSAGDTGELQQLADAACYAAKEAGRNRVHMVAGEKDSARLHQGQVRWVQRLREAMDNNRFAIYGQVIEPLTELDEPERMEILLRLRDPDTRRLIPPGAFLPAAERYGMSIELDQWVVESLLDTLFIHQAFEAEHRRYWINLSATSIGDRRFASFLMDAIKRSPLPPGTVNFEITETAVIRSVVEAGKLMSELREMGCQFALDDFGSGLSSFGYLKKLPVDYLKIDGMFVRDILNDETDRIFVKSIIDIAHTLNIKTIAQFVENDELLEVMRDLRADYAQGFAVGRPFVLAPRLSRPAGSDLIPAELKTKAG